MKYHFFGYSISKEGISPDEALIENILTVATPKKIKKSWSLSWVW